MSFFTDDEIEVTHKSPVIAINPPKTQSAVESLAYRPRKSIITTISGHPWSVDYYAQVLGADDGARSTSESASPLHEQYKLVRHFELKVDSPLSASQADDTKIMEVSGTANVYPVLIPNAGDLFIADIGDGRLGVFTVTATEDQTHFKDSVKSISYSLVDYLTPQREFDLRAKVVKTYHFRREYLDYGQDPLIEDELIAWVNSIEISYQQLMSTFFETYFSNEYRTFMVPGQDQPTYDPYLLDAVLAFFGSSQMPNWMQITRLNVDEDIAFRANTVFDAIAKRDLGILKHCIHEVGLTASTYFSTDASYHSIRYSGIRYVVYPDEKVINVDQQLHRNAKGITKAVLDEQVLNFRDQVREPAFIEYPALKEDSDPETPEYESVRVPLIHPIKYDRYYILSKAFYTQAPEGQSAIERQISDYLKGKAMNPDVLARLAHDWSNWGVLEKFYYTPLLLVLFHVHLRQF